MTECYPTTEHQLSSAKLMYVFPLSKASVFLFFKVQKCNLLPWHDNKLFFKTSVHIYLHALQPLFKEGQHLWQFIVRVHIVHSAAALLQQADDVLILNLFMHLELLKSGAQWLKKRAEIIVVGEVGLWQLWGKKDKEKLIYSKI